MCWEHRHSADEDSQRDQKEKESNLLKKNMIIHNTRKFTKVTKLQQIWTISTQASKQNTNSTLEKKCLLQNVQEKTKEVDSF